MRFEHGDSVAPLKVNGPAPAGKKGTRVTFCASTDTFKNVTEFDFEKLEHRYRELAFLNSGVRIKLVDARSEEHTSELQSLMRISYAVFCLKKKTNKQHYRQTNNIHKVNTPDTNS